MADFRALDSAAMMRLCAGDGMENSAPLFNKSALP
jgi:hypothetical protein